MSFSYFLFGPTMTTRQKFRKKNRKQLKKISLSYERNKLKVDYHLDATITPACYK